MTNIHSRILEHTAPAPRVPVNKKAKNVIGGSCNRETMSRKESNKEATRRLLQQHRFMPKSTDKEFPFIFLRLLIFLRIVDYSLFWLKYLQHDFRDIIDYISVVYANAIYTGTITNGISLQLNN